MKLIFDLLDKAATDLADGDLNSIIEVGNNYVYIEGDASPAGEICTRLVSFGKRLFIEGRLFQSYCIYSLALKFLSPTNWSSKQVLLLKGIRAAVKEYPEYSQASAYELISCITNAKNVPDKDHNQPNFIGDLHYLADCFAAQAKDPACPHYRLLAILFFELVIKHGTPINYVHLLHAKTRQAPLKVNLSIGDLLLLAETHLSDENLNAIQNESTKYVYKPAEAEVAKYVFMRLEVVGHRLFQEKRFSFCSIMYSSSLFYLPLTDINNWLNSLLNALTASISDDPVKAILIAEKVNRLIVKNYNHMVAPSANTMDRIFQAANYFAGQRNNNIKFTDASLNLLESICKLNFKSGKPDGYAKINDVILLKIALKQEKSCSNYSAADKIKYERKNMLFLGINAPPRTKIEMMTDESNSAQARTPTSSRI